MKTAILITGQMRTADLCFPSVKENLIPWIGDYDIFVSVELDEDAPKHKLYPNSSGELVRAPSFEILCYDSGKKRGTKPEDAPRILRQFWNTERGFKLIEESGVAYDWVIRLRPDLFFTAPIEDLAALPNDAIYIPTFHNFRGYNDRFAFGPMALMRIYSKRFSFYEGYLAAGGIFHPETILMALLKALEVPVARTQVRFDVVRKGGEHIPPQWNHEHNFGDIPPC